MGEKSDNDTVFAFAHLINKNAKQKKQANIQKIRSLILQNFLDGERAQINVSAIPSYAFKACNGKWRDIVNQKPMHFVHDMVNDGLVCLEKTIKNGSTYPYIVLNKKSKIIKTMKRKL